MRVKKAQGDIKRNILLALATSFPKLNEELCTLTGKDFVDAFYKLSRLALPTQTNIVDEREAPEMPEGEVKTELKKLANISEKYGS